MQLTKPAAPGDRFVNEQNVGQLLVIEVLEPAYNVQTENGPADCIRANVYVITPAGTIGAQYLGTLVFGKMLFSRLVQSVGKAVVGVLSGQPGVKVQGKNVPYDLEDPNDAMMVAAQRAMLTVAQPAQQQQPPQQWGQQPATQQAGPWGQIPPQQGGGAWGVPPNTYAQPSAQQGPPPGWGQQSATIPGQPWGGAPRPQEQGPPPQQQQPAAAGPWGQQQMPAAGSEDRPPWEHDPALQQAPAGPPWGGQQ
jgi:hypothetical protein